MRPMPEETTLCLVGKLPDCGCVAVHCEGYKQHPDHALENVTRNWHNMGLEPDLVDLATCEQTYRKCRHKARWYHDQAYVSPEARAHTVEILKAISVMRALKDTPEGSLGIK